MGRNTLQLDIISSVVRNMARHATAEEIYQEVIREYPSIGRSTVYRNLQKLCDQGVLRRRVIPSSADVYDMICTDHYHVQCAHCKKVFDVDMDYIADLEASIKNRHGFLITGHDITFWGVCPDCKKDA